MTALDLLCATGTAVLLLLVLGLPLAWAVGLRGYWFLAAAPAFALTMIAGTSVVAPWLGLGWSILPVVIVTVVIGAIIYITRRLWTKRADRVETPRERSRADMWLIGALVVAGAVIALRVMQIIGEPGNISQTFDNIFHLNGIRFILDEGNASPLRLGYMTSPDGTLPFYPSAWHAWTSLVVQLTGVSIPVAVNGVVLTTSAFVWPIGALLLVRTLFGAAPAITVAAAAVAASIPAFPILLMDYGVLYPFQLGLAMLPVALAATLPMLRLAPTTALGTPRWWWLVLLGSIPGMSIAHPGAFVALLALSAPMAIAFAVRMWRAGSGRTRVLTVVGFVVYVAVGAVLVRILRPIAEARGWPTQMSVPEALWQVLSVSMWYLVPAVVVALGALAGIVWALVDRRRGPLLALAVYGVGALLFITVAALPWPQLRDALTGSWYNNLPRLAAILAIAIVPLAAYGIGRTWTAAVSSAPGRRAAAAMPAWSKAVVGVAAGAALLVGMQVVVLPSAVSWASPLYLLDDDAPLLTADEYALLTRIPQHVPEGAVIAGSPWTGSSLAYALGDRPVLMPHTLMQITDEMEDLNEGLDSADPGSPACAAVRDLGVGFVLDFGTQEVHPGTHPYPGLDELAESDRVRLVDSEGAARLYEIVACG